MHTVSKKLAVNSSSFVTANADIVAGLGEWVPRDVEPIGGGQELVGIFPILEEIHERGELFRIFWADVGSLTEEMLGVADTPYPTVDGLATKA